MARYVFCIMIIIFLSLASWPAIAHNPTVSPVAVDQERVRQDSLFETIARWQHQLRKKMAPLVRNAGAAHEPGPLLAALMIAFVYGIIHAAGPGHGKAVAMSFVLSRNANAYTGLLFGTLTAFSHGLSGVICVLVIRYVIQAGFFGTFGTISRTTQIVSFGIIALLGLGILVKSGYSLLTSSRQTAQDREQEIQKKTLLPWALAIGLVPCPGVVTVLLFCLSMDMLALGILMAGFISLGMACTISIVVIAVIKGRDLSLSRVPQRRMENVQGILGLGSGFAVTAIGLFFSLSFI